MHAKHAGKPPAASEGQSTYWAGILLPGASGTSSADEHLPGHYVHCHDPEDMPRESMPGMCWAVMVVCLAATPEPVKLSVEDDERSALRRSCGIIQLPGG